MVLRLSYEDNMELSYPSKIIFLSVSLCKAKFLKRLMQKVKF